MKKEIADLWVAALESGRYRQGRQALHEINRDGEHVYCCLGVLCELAIENGQNVSKNYSLTKTNRKSYHYDGCHTYLPKSVQDWSGMKKNDGYFGKGGNDVLSVVNDHNYDFQEVIKIIKEKWEMF